MASNASVANTKVIAAKLDDVVSAHQAGCLSVLREVAAELNARYGVTRGAATKLARVMVPLVPLEVQRAVAAELDTFSALEEGLEEALHGEAQARLRQLTSYRDTLTQFPDSVERVPMGELGDVFRGRRFTKRDYVEEGVAAIHYGDLYTHYGTAATEALARVRIDLAARLRFAQPGDVIITEVGETVEDVGKATAWLGDEPVAVHDGCFGFRSPLNPRFVAHYMHSRAFQADKSRHVARAKMKRLSLQGLKQIHLPVPDWTVQTRIADALDSLDALVNDLSSSLPAEIAARRKQFEYYRDRLLTFEELES